MRDVVDELCEHLWEEKSSFVFDRVESGVGSIKLWCATRISRLRSSAIYKPPRFWYKVSIHTPVEPVLGCSESCTSSVFEDTSRSTTALNWAFRVLPAGRGGRVVSACSSSSESSITLRFGIVQ